MGVTTIVQETNIVFKEEIFYHVALPIGVRIPPHRTAGIEVPNQKERRRQLFEQIF